MSKTFQIDTFMLYLYTRRLIACSAMCEGMTAEEGVGRREMSVCLVCLWEPLLISKRRNTNTSAVQNSIHNAFRTLLAPLLPCLLPHSLMSLFLSSIILLSIGWAIMFKTTFECFHAHLNSPKCVRVCTRNTMEEHVLMPHSLYTHSLYLDCFKLLAFW